MKLFLDVISDKIINKKSYAGNSLHAGHSIFVWWSFALQAIVCLPFVDFKNALNRCVLVIIWTEIRWLNKDSTNLLFLIVGVI